jgi:hypothetical protein
VNVFLLYLDLPKVFITRWYMLRWILATEESIQSKKKKNIDSIPAFPIFLKKTRIKVKFKTCVFLTTWCTPIIPVFCQ